MAFKKAWGLTVQRKPMVQGGPMRAEEKKKIWPCYEKLSLAPVVYNPNFLEIMVIWILAGMEKSCCGV